MYNGFNAKKERKRMKVEKLETEVKRLQQLLGAMIRVHERLKNERIENSEVAKLPSLPGEVVGDGKSIE